MKTPFSHAALLGTGLLALACGEGYVGIPGGENSAASGTTAAPLCTTTGKSYAGFGGTLLAAGRVEQKVGWERRRVKPYSALVTTTSGGTTFPGELQRVLGNNPALLTTTANTYDGSPARWYFEPQASAVNMYTSYRVALQGCSAALTDPKYNTAPTEATARAECSTWMHTAWNRAPLAFEVDACVAFALNKTLIEKVGSMPVATTTSAARRWVYTCGSILIAAGFITY